MVDRLTRRLRRERWNEERDRERGASGEIVDEDEHCTVCVRACVRSIIRLIRGAENESCSNVQKKAITGSVRKRQELMKMKI